MEHVPKSTFYPMIPHIITDRARKPGIISPAPISLSSTIIVKNQF